MKPEIPHDQCIVPDLRFVRYYVALAEELNFRRAAERVSISQPPFSRAIQTLERQVGTKLFHRTNREVRLTATGQALLPDAYRLLEQERRLRISADKLADGQTGLLKIGCVTAAFYDVLPPVINRFRELYSRIELTLREFDTVGALTALREREINVAFVTPEVVAAPLKQLALHEDAIVVALPHGHPLSKARKISFPKLADEPLVIFPREESPKLYDTIIAAFHGAGVTPKFEREAKSILSQLGFVACGLGVALVPRSIERFAMQDVVFRELKENISLADICAVWNSKDDSPLTRNFVSLVTMT